jgi:WD40 repeat protein
VVIDLVRILLLLVWPIIGFGFVQIFGRSCMTNNNNNNNNIDYLQFSKFACQFIHHRRRRRAPWSAQHPSKSSFQSYMLNKLTQGSSNNPQLFKSTKSIQNINNQYGLQCNNIQILIDLPSETLTGVTSYLDPPSLLSLGRVNSHLHEHVNNDNTWRQAFVCQFLDIGPEGDVHDNIKCLMLRRSERSWKNELIVRYKLRRYGPYTLELCELCVFNYICRRWERSRNPTVTYTPLPSLISSMYLMPGHSLLVSSIEYGVVSRSFALTGKVLPGFLDASGTRIDMGVGNPNAGFTPNVSVCVIASDGGTARVLWGFRNGEVAVMTAPKTMDAGRRISTELVRCDVNDEHEGAVLDGLWDSSGVAVITAGADGKAKVWDAKGVRCIWASEKKPGSLVPDACVKVASAMSQGYVVGVLRSGEIVLWVGFDLQPLDTVSASSVREIRIPWPASSFHGKTDSSQGVSHDIMSLYLDSSTSCPTILVSYQGDPYFYRVRIAQDDHIDVAAFGEAQFGPISVLTPFFFTDSSFVLTGDYLGCVSIYDWCASTTTTSKYIQSVKKFEAHEDGGSVTALAWNGVTLVTGSARGTTHVWDGLSFEHLRSFASPVPSRRSGDGREREAVSQILVGPEKDVLLVAIGDKVLGWRAGPVGKNGSGGVRGRHASGTRLNKKTRERYTAKYLRELIPSVIPSWLSELLLEKIEMQENISESRTILDMQSKNIRRANGREREQIATLESLGLDEAEAVEYVLMLSRDEALRDGRGYSTTNAEEYQSATPVEEGVFEGDFDDMLSAHHHPIAEPLAMALSLSSSLESYTRSRVSTPQSNGRPIHRAGLSRSNQTIQISPLYKPEPMEAGFNTGSLVTTPLSDVPSDESHFPPISASTSPVAMGGRNGSPNQRQGPSSVSVSPHSVRSVASTSAWKTPLIKSGAGSPSSLSPGRGSRISPPAMPLGPSPSLPLADIDDDLRLAIELSLADARNRVV